MDTTQTETLARIEGAVQDIESAVQAQERQLHMLVQGQAEIIKKLTSEPKDGPSLDELIGHMIGQLSELTGYAGVSKTWGATPQAGSLGGRSVRPALRP